MKYDKKQAILHRWRVPEKTLWLISILFGSLGSTLGMWHYAHKSSKKKFFIGFPLLCIVQIIIICVIIK